MNDIITIISTVGFPIAACVGMGWFVKYQTDLNNKNIETMRQEQNEQIRSMTNAVKNNTVALQQLVDKLDLCKAVKDSD